MFNSKETEGKRSEVVTAGPEPGWGGTEYDRWPSAGHSEKAVSQDSLGYGNAYDKDTLDTDVLWCDSG